MPSSAAQSAGSPTLYIVKRNVSCDNLTEALEFIIHREYSAVRIINTWNACYSQYSKRVDGQGDRKREKIERKLRVNFYYMLVSTLFISESELVGFAVLVGFRFGEELDFGSGLVGFGSVMLLVVDNVGENANNRNV